MGKSETKRKVVVIIRFRMVSKLTVYGLLNITLALRTLGIGFVENDRPFPKVH